GSMPKVWSVASWAEAMMLDSPGPTLRRVSWPWESEAGRVPTLAAPGGPRTAHCEGQVSVGAVAPLRMMKVRVSELVGVRVVLAVWKVMGEEAERRSMHCEPLKSRAQVEAEMVAVVRSSMILPRKSQPWPMSIRPRTGEPTKFQLVAPLGMKVS